MSGDHPNRKRMTDTRVGRRYVATIEVEGGDIDVYVLINRYEDTGAIGEIFVNVSKQGSVLQGTLDGWAIMASMALQYGVPVEVIINKFKGQGFPPSGRVTRCAGVDECSSLLDLVVRILEIDATAQVRG